MISFLKQVLRFTRGKVVIEKDTRPHYKVETLEGEYLLYTQNKPIRCPDIQYYRYTGNSFEGGRFKEVEACLLDGSVIFKGYITIFDYMALQPSTITIKRY